MTKTRWARVLIVEDSPTAARILANGIARDPRLAVAGIAQTASDAVLLAEQLAPDVVTVDLLLPDQTGLDVILRILRLRYVPIVVVTALPQNSSSLAFRALLAGAADIVLKPAGTAAQLDAFFDDLNERLALLASAAAVPTHTHPPPRMLRRRLPEARAGLACVAVGASTGGPPALVDLLSGLGADFLAPVLVVQHIAAPFVEGLVRWLNQETPLPVSLARHGQRLEPGHVYVAPAACDMTVGPGGVLVVTPAQPRRTHIAPSADALFESVAAVYGPSSAAVLLSGMGKDGAAGLLKVRKRGGKTFAQDRNTSTVFGMPDAAGRMGAVDAFAEPRSIGLHLRKLAAGSERVAR
jgi:two-component system chemotaxis response regulator CheB